MASLRHTSKFRTICEVLRETNDIIQDPYIPPSAAKAIRAKLVEVEKMAKSIVNKLFEYNKEWDKDFWAANPDYEMDVRKRLATTYIVPDKDDGKPSEPPKFKQKE